MIEKTENGTRKTVEAEASKMLDELADKLSATENVLAEQKKKSQEIQENNTTELNVLKQRLNELVAEAALVAPKDGQEGAADQETLNALERKNVRLPSE